MKNLIYLIFLIVIFNLFSCSSGESEAPFISVKDFFRNPQKSDVQISPDGTHIALLQPWKNRKNIFVHKIGGNDIERITDAVNRDIAGYLWANNERIVYVQDNDGDENFQLYAVNYNGRKEKKLTDFKESKVILIDQLKNNENEMLICLNKRDKRIFDVYRIDINTGDLQMVAENPGNVIGWKADHNGYVRLAVAQDGLNSKILFRNNEKDNFTEVLAVDYNDKFYPVCFDYDNKNIFATTNINRDKKAIVEFDPISKQIVKTIYEHPDVDVDEFYCSDQRKTISYAIFYKEKMGYQIFDEEFQSIKHEIDKKFPSFESVIANTSTNESKLIIKIFNDKNPGTYYYYNRTTGEFIKLLDVCPWINPENMASVTPIKYKSRDGLTINGYLTLPKGRKKTNLPLVVFPHGGPWYRDKWVFNKEIQFLANRGYGVLQVNYRGSTGYGKRFLSAGYKEWGGKIQDDVTDGVHWLISEGIADSNKIAIFGVSFGGFMALSGLTFTPDLYTCGISYVGISNILSFIKGIPSYWQIQTEVLYEKVGNPKTEEKMLKNSSPYYYVDKIKVPVFIAQGANDPRVNNADGYHIRDALLENNIEVVFMEKKDEGHGYKNEENRLDFYHQLEKFLAKHMGGRKE